MNRKPQDLQKPVPGCMGRMINIFDLGVGTTSQKMLTEKAHRDGYPLCRSRSEVTKKVLTPVGVQTEDKPTVLQLAQELRRSSSEKKSGGTPMKMLIAQEMSRETDPKQKPTSVVARLMGLEALPTRQLVPVARGNMEESCKHNVRTLGSVIRGYQKQENREDGRFEKPILCDVYPLQRRVYEPKVYKDVHEVWQQPSGTNRIKDQPLTKGRYNENLNEKRMALVRQKFIEAKRLATDQKLLHSEEFQDALEVLSSNRDLFLKFLEEPNSLFSKHLHELRTASLGPQTKRITVLKPTKTMESSGKQMKRQPLTVEKSKWDKQELSWSPNHVHSRTERSLSQPTRIVVLKPSPGKPHCTKDAVGHSSLPPGMVEGGDNYGHLADIEALGSREVARGVTMQMRARLSGNWRGENLLTSVLSNGYTGDESSLDRSENKYIQEESSNYSDTEVVTPTSWRSWDYINRIGSPHSLSSFSQASYSPESSVIREAKKRLSERWAMVTSSGISEEQPEFRRSSSTLGEMLALSEIKKEEASDGGITVLSSSGGEEKDLGVATACLPVTRKDLESDGKGSPKNLQRSKSVPVSSLAYENVGLKVEASNSLVNKSSGPKMVKTARSGRSLFKGKVSSLFSWSKKPSKEKSGPSPFAGSHDRVQSIDQPSTGKINGEFSPDGSHDAVLLTNLEESSCKDCSPSTSESDGRIQDTSAKEVSHVDKMLGFQNTIEAQDQPSPISVLEALFEDDATGTSSRSLEGSNPEYGQLISRSRPIESVARTLSWDDGSHKEPTLSNSSKHSQVLSRTYGAEDWFVYTRTLLSSAGFANEKCDTVLLRWHSLESPLNPTLLDKFLDCKEQEVATCRERRSNQRLLFDCINAALLDISPSMHQCRSITAGAPVIEEVWRRVKEWFSNERRVLVQSEDSSLVVERVVMEEVIGRGWAESMALETAEFGKEIERQVLEELVGEALDEFICSGSR